jgi:anaerobic ribonucleoside-triphosphate reductase
MENKIEKVQKRDGTIVPFDQSRIEEAIFKALTATGEGDGKRAKKLSNKVVQILNRRFKKGEIPHVEQIQDIVEEVLILEGLVKTAKAYILYREQRRRIREAIAVSEEAVDRLDQYIEKLDWEVQENANMAFSLQGLNHYGVTYIIKKYWLNKIYPKEIREAYESGDFHIHNLDTLGPYCVGWDLYDLLIKGFGGVPGKVESKPAKHFRSALGQVVNFMYTLQGEAAGAISFSNFDTLLAPFIRYDNLNYQQVKQALQEFLFNMAIPTRVGFQCVSEDTEILTPDGWKRHNEIKEGDIIKTFNLKTGEIEDKKVDFVFKRKYKGIMYRLRNRIQDQLISPEHRVLRRKFNTQNYVLQPIEEVLKLKSPIIVPIAGKNPRPDYPISDEQIKLMAWIISEGSVERAGKYRSSYRISIYQSKTKNPENYNEIINLLNHFNFVYTNHPVKSLGGEVQQIRLNAESSKKVHQWFGTRENVHFIPKYLLKLSERQSRLFLETYLKGDGKEGCKITTSDPNLLNALQTIIVNAGWGFTVRKQKATNPKISQSDIYILRIIRHSETYISKIEKVNYEGIIWCPHTENETMIARRNGKVFITGNCPFTNITLDLKPSPVFAKMPVIIGGKPQDKTYSEFEEEMKIFDKALYEVYMEGDAKGRPFHFPIPTINITKDFPWDEPAFDGIFEASAKYGTNYFANYINSEMKPEDVRSMCLEANEEILIRNSRKIKRLSIKEVIESYKKGDFDNEGWAECKKEGNLEVLSLNPQTLKLEWVPVKRFLKIKDDKAVEVITEDGKISIFSLKHPVSVYTPGGIKMKFAKDLQKGDYLLTLKRANENIFSNEYQKIEDLVLDEDLAKILGYFVADGNYLFENRKGYTHFGEPKGMQFTFKTGDRKNLNEIKHLIEKVLKSTVREKQDPRYNTYYLYVYNAEIARKLYKAGFRKYGRLPQILFNSPKSVIESFLEFYFRGDGYDKRKEIHLNDLELSRDLVLLFSLVGRPVTYKLRKRSQRIYLQHAKSKIKKGNGWLNNPILAERVPGWMAVSTAKVPGLAKSRTVGLNTLEKYNAHSEESLKIKNSDIYLVRVKEIKIRRYKRLKEFYDIELERNHLFVHSLGQISFNCCRLRLDLTELYNRGGGGLFGAGSKTGSIGVVTINLPRIGYLSKTKKEFFERLARIMDLAKESLEIKRKVLENYIEKGLYPYSRYYLQDIKQMRGKYWANHFSTIGLVGMNECLLNFMGENIASKRGRKFALEVLDFMRERLVKYQKETGNIYNLEATPAESTAYRLALKDKERYPDIITAGTKKVPFYTNSSQLPVNYTDDVFEALKLQDELQCKYSGGTVLHIFLGERMQSGEGVKRLVKKIFENFRLPYITITPTFSICPVHGYISGEHFFCPKCTIKQPCEVYSRIVGYYRPVQQWNLGKQQEFKQRKEFKIKEATLK